ncbi:hypothetical protein QYF52_15525 [Paenibacillus polymyxa]|uniref:hypothetical protein n=1 Tax=Paenibacillus TaxID=44249 RepID=UPI0025B659BC|nr:hypothetical protein [Paenibacillus polymyxa]MDN4079357.1 hypothetical protein [Paenibacillus polymyxa]MDN4104778.1 hypothetical protein [Paenibacillus polymyxa]MDN4115185.1 hypothetical protein [Paenibacillus polymyxa]
MKDDYKEYLLVKQEFANISKEVPLLFTWLIEMLQKLEYKLATILFLKEQAEIVEKEGTSKLSPDLFDENMDFRISEKNRKRFVDKIENSVGDASFDNEELLTILRNMDFKVFKFEDNSRFIDIFHECRKYRNYLAHEFFVEYTLNGVDDSKVKEMEEELENILWDTNTVVFLADQIINSFAHFILQFIVEEAEEVE